MEYFYQRMESDQSSGRRIGRMFIVLYLFAITFIICMQSPMNPFHVSLSGVDSSVFHYVAAVMKKGGVIYRDTFDHKGPLLYFINYLGLCISYYSGAWFLELLTLLSWTCLTYKTARLFCRKIPACFVVFLSATALVICFFGGNYPECYTLPCISGSLYIFTDYFLNRRINRFRLIACGGLLSCALMLKPNTISVWIVFCLAVLIQMICQKEIRQLFSFMGWFLLGMSLVMVPVFFYLVKMDIVPDFFNTYILFNLQYSGNAGLRASVIAVLKCMRKELVFPCLLIIFFLIFQKKEQKFYWGTYVVYLILSVLLCSMSGNDYIYYRISLVPCYAIPVAMFLSEWKYDRNHTDSIQVLLIIGAAVLVQQWPGPVVHTLSEIKNMTNEVDLGDEHHQELFRLIEEYTDEDEPFIVYGNENAFYFYSHRFAASRYSFQYPVILMNEEIREDFFQELDEKRPTLILVQSLWCDDEYIQEFLETHPYRSITDFDDYALYLRVDEQ